MGLGKAFRCDVFQGLTASAVARYSRDPAGPRGASGFPKPNNSASLPHLSLTDRFFRKSLISVDSSTLPIKLPIPANRWKWQVPHSFPLSSEERT
jgi:hypothetical protein